MAANVSVIICLVDGKDELLNVDYFHYLRFCNGDDFLLFSVYFRCTNQKLLLWKVYFCLFF